MYELLCVIVIICVAFVMLLFIVSNGIYVVVIIIIIIDFVEMYGFHLMLMSCYPIIWCFVQIECRGRTSI